MENEVNIVPDELFNGKVFLPEDDWMDTDISEDWLDPTDEWETAKNSLYIGDAPVCAQGGLTLLTGQSGNGKTMTLAMMMAAVFRRKYGQFELGPDIEAPTILYVDTEMEKYNTQRLMNRVYYLNGWEFKTNKPQLRIIRLRDTVNVKERWRKVLKAINEVKPTFCFLDGLLDLVEDFNDNKECHLLIRKLMSAATWYDMSLVGVIHQNPGGDKMAGHIGSFGERKAITVLATKKDKNGNEVVFKVEQKKARDKDAEDLQFRVEDDKLHIGIPVPVDSQVEDNNTIYRNFETIMAGLTLSTRDIRAKVMDKMHLSANQAMKIIKQAVDEGILNADEVWNADHTKIKSCHYTFINKDKPPF